MYIILNKKNNILQLGFRNLKSTNLQNGIQISDTFFLTMSENFYDSNSNNIIINNDVANALILKKSIQEI